MATMTQSSVSFSAEDNKAFTYTLPTDGAWGFVLGPQLDSAAPPTIVDNGNGTGTLKYAAAVTGSVDIWTVQKP